MKDRKRLLTMSTDGKKKKHGFPRIERIKIIEYGCIGLVVLLFWGLAVFYGGKKSEDHVSDAEVSPSPLPTEDPSIRGKNVLDALEKAEFTVIFLQEYYDLHSPDGVAFEMRMESDNHGLIKLSFETFLCPDPDEETETAKLIRAENKQSLEAIRTLFDAIMPVFHRPIADSDTITKQCEKVVKTGETYAKHFSNYSVRITSDPEVIPQRVTVRFVRDS